MTFRFYRDHRHITRELEKFSSGAQRSSSAFTLVETVLALLAISLGLLGVFGLARHGLKNAGDTENEIRCALLADTILETLKAKNAELQAKKTPLYDWWVYWFSVLDPSRTTAACYLPPLPEIDPVSDNIGVFVGTHTLGDASVAAGELKWNPIYCLTLEPAFDKGDLTSLDSIYAAYERGQLAVTLTIHPGKLQGGATTYTYYATLTYSGGLP